MEEKEKCCSFVLSRTPHEMKSTYYIIVPVVRQQAGILLPPALSILLRADVAVAGEVSGEGLVVARIPRPSFQEIEVRCADSVLVKELFINSLAAMDV
jgi:hypothetical protein